MPSYRQAMDNIIPLTERNGAPRHDDEKQRRLIQQAVRAALDERDEVVVKKMQGLIDRLDTGMNRLFNVVEGFAAGERDTSVATLVEGETDDLPSVARFKADSTTIFTLSTTEIGERLGTSRHDISFLLNSGGLDWVGLKPDLWDAKTYKKTNRRFWHPKVVELLRAVLEDPAHDEREGASTGCLRVLNRCCLSGSRSKGAA